jgi:hypothetical protein
VTHPQRIAPALREFSAAAEEARKLLIRSSTFTVSYGMCGLLQMKKAKQRLSNTCAILWNLEKSRNSVASVRIQDGSQ